MRSPLKALPAALAGLAFIAAGASAQAPQSNPSEWNRPYGQSHQDVSQPFAGARSRAGNRVVINGIIQTGVGVSAQASAFAQGLPASAAAFRTAQVPGPATPSIRPPPSPISSTWW